MKLEPFERYYTLKQCRKLKKLLDNASVTDPDLAMMYEDLSDVIRDAEERIRVERKRGKRKPKGNHETES